MHDIQELLLDFRFLRPIHKPVVLLLCGQYACSLLAIYGLDLESMRELVSREQGRELLIKKTGILLSSLCID